MKDYTLMLICSDLHCGHLVGLTPPSWQTKYLEKSVEKQNKFATIQRECWAWFQNEILKVRQEHGHIDIGVFNGDLIDGREEKSGSTELIQVSREKQAQMASDIILFTGTKKVVITYGTDFHTGAREQWEDVVVDKLKGNRSVKKIKIGAHEWLNVNGVIFDFKHHTGTSGVPASRHNALNRERLWNSLWAERKEQPKSSVIVRSHTHYFGYAGNSECLMIGTPALQGMGSRFGSKLCSGTIDYGFITFRVFKNGTYDWQPHIVKIKSQVARAIKL